MACPICGAATSGKFKRCRREDRLDEEDHESHEAYRRSAAHEEAESDA